MNNFVKFDIKIRFVSFFKNFEYLYYPLLLWIILQVAAPNILRRRISFVVKNTIYLDTHSCSDHIGLQLSFTHIYSISWHSTMKVPSLFFSREKACFIHYFILLSFHIFIFMILFFWYSKYIVNCPYSIFHFFLIVVGAFHD